MAQLTLDRPIYGPLDLGELDPERKGQTLRVLLNPTLKLRGEFTRAAFAVPSDRWLELVAQILDTTTEHILDEDKAGNVEHAIFAAIFAHAHEGYDKEAGEYRNLSQAHILHFWDTYAIARRKAYAVRS